MASLTETVPVGLLAAAKELAESYCDQTDAEALDATEASEMSSMKLQLAEVRHLRAQTYMLAFVLEMHPVAKVERDRTRRHSA